MSHARFEMMTTLTADEQEGQTETGLVELKRAKAEALWLGGIEHLRDKLLKYASDSRLQSDARIKVDMYTTHWRLPFDRDSEELYLLCSIEAPRIHGWMVEQPDYVPWTPPADEE